MVSTKDIPKKIIESVKRIAMNRQHKFFYHSSFQDKQWELFQKDNQYLNLNSHK